MDWLRLYHSTLNSKKCQGLPAREFKFWINCLLVASQNDPRGALPPVEELAFLLRLRAPFVLHSLTACERAGLVENKNGHWEMHDWDAHQFESDDINQRVRKFRDKKRNVSGNVTCNAHVTPSDTDTETDTETKGTTTTPTPPPQPPTVFDLAEEFDPNPISPEVPKPTRKPSVDYRKEFEEHWDANIFGGKFGDKQAACRAWEKVRRSGVSLERLVAKIREQYPIHHELARRAGRTVLHPATYLNGGRYEDDTEILARPLAVGPRIVHRLGPQPTKRDYAAERAMERVIREKAANG